MLKGQIHLLHKCQSWPIIIKNSGRAHHENTELLFLLIDHPTNVSSRHHCQAHLQLSDSDLIVWRGWESLQHRELIALSLQLLMKTPTGKLHYVHRAQLNETLLKIDQRLVLRSADVLRQRFLDYMQVAPREWCSPGGTLLFRSEAALID
jgi:hypothetical protein